MAQTTEDEATKTIAFRIPTSLWEDTKILAIKERTTMADIAERAIRDYVYAQGRQ